MASEQRVLVTWAVKGEERRAMLFHEFVAPGGPEPGYADIVRQMIAATRERLQPGEHIEIDDDGCYPVEKYNAVRWPSP